MATLSTVERRAINLTWAKPFDGNSPLMRYILEMSENSKVPHRPLPMSPTWPGQSGVWSARSPVQAASLTAHLLGLSAEQIFPLGSHGFFLCKEA